LPVIANSVVATVSGNPSWITFNFSLDNVIVTAGQVLAFQPIATGVHGQVVGKEIGFVRDNAPRPKRQLRGYDIHHHGLTSA